MGRLTAPFRAATTEDTEENFSGFAFVVVVEEEVATTLFFSFFFTAGFSVSSVSAVVDFFFLSYLAIASANHAALTGPRDAGRCGSELRAVSWLLESVALYVVLANPRPLGAVVCSGS